MSALASKVRQPLLVRLTYVKNANKARENVRTTLRTLGFTKLNQSIVHKNVLPIRGMIHQLKHYLTVEPMVWTPENPAKAE